MIRRIRRGKFVRALGLALSGSMLLSVAQAHHSFAQYEMTKTMEIEGTVQKFEWSNPHSWLFVQVPKSADSTTSYGFELQSVGEMLRRGWTKTALKPGDKVKVSFRPMRDGTPAGLLQSAWGNDGKMIGRMPGGSPAPTPAAAGSGG